MIHGGMPGREHKATLENHFTEIKQDKFLLSELAVMTPSYFRYLILILFIFILIICLCLTMVWPKPFFFFFTT